MRNVGDERPTLIVIEGSYGTMDENLLHRFSSLLNDDFGYSFIYLPELLPSLTAEARKYFLPSLGDGDIRPFVERFYATAAESFGVELSEGKIYCLYSGLDSGWNIIDITGRENSQWMEELPAVFLECESLEFPPVEDSADLQDISLGSVPSEIKRSAHPERAKKSILLSKTEKPLRKAAAPDRIGKPLREAAHKKKDLDSETVELMNQAKTIVEKMKSKGLGIDFIASWLNSLNSLSRLRITAKGKILLTDYDLEVKMSPLPKTVFLFYLRHEEEVPNLALGNYGDELYRIYGKLAKSDNPEKMHSSIDLLTDPYDNSMFEKCSYIKAAFECVVDPSIAKHYYISSHGMISRRIPLDRALVDWELEI